MKVVKFDNYANVTVQVGETDYYVTTRMGNIKAGNVHNPFRPNAPIGFTDPKYEFLGCIFKTNQGYYVRILNCEDRKHTLYEFIDNGYQDTTYLWNIFAGTVRNPYHRDKFGGYLGPDKTYRKDEYDWLYTVWKTLLIRGVAENKEYYLQYHNTHAYDDVLFDERWRCYGEFAAWYMYHYRQLNPGFDYSVDKDLKFPFYSQYTGGRRCYSPETCVLIPQTLNVMLTSPDVLECLENNRKLPGNHKIKYYAEYLKEEEAISDEVYNIIMQM
jgi:hypothetical protein